MDVEKTIEFILEQQARAEVALVGLAEEHKKTDAVLRRAIRAGVEEARRQRVRTKRLEENMDARSKRLEENMDARTKRLEENMNQLTNSLKAFIDSMQRGGNGRH